MNKDLRNFNEADYYAGRVPSSQFYITSEFPKFFGKAECMMMNDNAPLVVSLATFTGSLKE